MMRPTFVLTKMVEDKTRQDITQLVKYIFKKLIKLHEMSISIAVQHSHNKFIIHGAKNDQGATSHELAV